jgi:hypothetical protein
MKDWRWLILTALLAAGGAAVLVAVLADGDGPARPTTQAQPTRPRVQAPEVVQNAGFLTGAPGRRGRGLATPAASISALGATRDPTLEGAVAEAYALRAYPAPRVAIAQAQRARSAFEQLPLRLDPAIAPNATSSLSLPENWRFLGPTRAKALPFSVGLVGFPNRATVVSGRITSIAIGRRCVPGDCRLYVGSAGGGVFRTDNALAPVPRWRSVSEGLTSIAIGALALDPRDRTGNTVYAGTGEASSSADSEAGLGVFKTTNGGRTWKLLPGSLPVTRDRGVSGIALDPRNPRIIYVSTTPSLHGSSAVAGGFARPPGTAPLGVYRSTDGGNRFSLIFQPQNGDNSWGGVKQIALDPNDRNTIFASVAGEGIYRRSPRADGNAFRRIFTAANPSREGFTLTLFALADLGRRTRIYVSDSDAQASSGLGGPSGVTDVWRLDNAQTRASAALAARKRRAGWRRLSDARMGRPGFPAYRHCQQQCWYSTFIASPAGKPNYLWLGGAADYAGDDPSGAWSNGRVVIRSRDAGRSFTDMSADSQAPPFLLHPDSHTITFSPNNPEVAFIGTDGGLVRTSGTFANVTRRCLRRGLAPLALRTCRGMLRQVPRRLFSLNNGLTTLQFQSVSISPSGTPLEVLGGTQDNGTWSYTPRSGWVNAAGGDGGQSVVGKGRNPAHIHTWFGPAPRVNFSGFNENTWRHIYPVLTSSGERSAFYVPLIADPVEAGTLFIGLQHVWRTYQYGGPRQILDRDCNGITRLNPDCGRWVPLGDDLTGATFGSDRADEAGSRNYVAAIARATGDSGTLWAATVPGRVLVTSNADALPAAVRWTRVDIPTTLGRPGTPGRFVSGIAIDASDPLHAWISYSGYDAHTPDDRPGHVFEVRVNPTTRRATWKNVSYDLKDQPITALARHPGSGDLYAATDFGVLRLPAGATRWTEAAEGLPLVAVYGLTIAPDGSTLYAATHGRGVWTLRLPT